MLARGVTVHMPLVHRNPAGEHYRPLAADFIRTRLQIAAELSVEGSKL